MGIALLAFSGLFQGLSNFNRPAAPAAKPMRKTVPSRPQWAARHGSCEPMGVKAAPAHHTAKTGLNPVLRVVRVADSNERVKGAGRMVISGRMADVCAELDRMAALEASQAHF